jgi:hypothetical protein
VGAIFAGSAFVCSGYVASLTENLVYLYPICLMPIFCLALEASLTRGGLWIPIAGAVWASVFLNGDIQNGYYYGFMALAWGLTRTGKCLQTISTLGLIAGLAALLSAIQLAPAWAVYVQSNRANPEAFHYQSITWSTHPLRLAGLINGPGPMENFLDLEIAHAFFGAQAPSQSMTGLWAESLYVGLPVFGLALLAGILGRGLRAFVIIGGVSLWLALGQYAGLFDALYGRMPLWTAFRYPEKFMGYVSFSIAMLSGAGFEYWRKGNGCAMPWLLASGLCGLLAGLMYFQFPQDWVSSHFGSRPDLTSQALKLAAKGLLFASAMSLMMGALAYWIGKWGEVPAWILAGIVVIILVDLYRVNAPACRTGPAEAWEFVPNLVEPIRRDSGHSGPGYFRVVPFREPVFIITGDMKRALDPYQVSSVMLKQSLDLEHNATYRIELPYGYLPGFNETFEALGKVFSVEVAARFNVLYYIGRPYHFESKRFKNIPVVAYVPANDLALAKNPITPKPRAYVSLKPEASTHPVDIKALASKEEFLAGMLDVIEVAGDTLTDVGGQGTAELLRYEPEEVEILVDVPKPAVLVLSDYYADGWKARLEDGSPMQVRRANGLMRAVIVPPGKHTVSFTYRTPLLKEGAWLSLFGLLITIVFFLIDIMRKMNRATWPSWIAAT